MKRRNRGQEPLDGCYANRGPCAGGSYGRNVVRSTTTLPALCIFLFLTIPLLTVLTADAQQSQPAKAPNPHWVTDACDACHVMKDKKAQTLEFAEAERICLSCHDGIRAESEAHPVHRLLDSQQFRNPGWPLLDGNVVCLTCHDISRTTGHKNAQPTKSDFLRPARGQGPDAFCASCHKPVNYNRINPHRMMTPQGQVVPADCLLCHTVVPDHKPLARTGKSDLRVDELTLCRSCHYYHVDWFEPGHIGAKVPPKILTYMRARELVGPASRPSREVLARLQSQGARPQDWPLGPSDTLTCTTCHNPHQRGVFPPDSALARGALEVQNNRVVSPIEVPLMCLRCHSL